MLIGSGAPGIAPDCIAGILLRAGPETRQGHIRIQKMSGQNPFLAYGVINDGETPGQRSGDGAYLPARE